MQSEQRPALFLVAEFVGVAVLLFSAVLGAWTLLSWAVEFWRSGLL